MSEREKFYIESNYHQFAAGDLEKARQDYQIWAQTYPRDDAPPAGLALIYTSIGQYDKALAENLEALRLEPARGLYYANFVFAYLNLGRFQEARARAEEAQAKELDTPYLRFRLYSLAFLQSDGPGRRSR